MASFFLSFADLADGLSGLDRVQARRLHDELAAAGLDDPRRLLAVGGADGMDIIADIFDDTDPNEQVMVKDRGLWAMAASGARWEQRRRYPPSV